MAGKILLGGRLSLRLAVFALTGFLSLVVGCTEAVNTYHVSNADSGLAVTDRVLVLPFLDSRTFTDPNDPYRETLGEHARDVFTTALKENASFNGTIVDAPGVPDQKTSLSIAEVADLGRAYGADYVVAGQVFSYTGTRAASIPARAGMFVRIVSARDGSLIFVGDHYQAAAVPGATGGRELQARLVAEKLVDSFATRLKSSDHAVLRQPAASSIAAYASIPPGAGMRRIWGNDTTFPEPLPLLPPPDFTVTPVFDESSDAASGLPEVPPVLDYGEGDDFFKFSAGDVAAATEKNDESADAWVSPANSGTAEAEEVASTGEAAEEEFVATAPPSLEEAMADGEIAENSEGKSEGTSIESATVAVVDEAVEAEVAEVPEVPVDDAAPVVAAADVDADADADMASEAWMLTGDELAADLFEEEGAYDTMLALRRQRLAANESSVQTEVGQTAVEAAVIIPQPIVEAPAPVVAELAAVPEEETAVLADVAVITSAAEEPAESVQQSVEGDGYMTQRQYFESVGAWLADDAAVIVEEPLALQPIVTADIIAQPAPTYAVDMVVQQDTASVAAVPDTEFISSTLMRRGDVKVLILPYHERENPDNLIAHTGGGEVVTALFGAKLAMEPGVQVMWSGGNTYTHNYLASVDEAIAYGRMSGVDYIVRGQVVEFRRAQSVPSFYSAVISTAVLAAQIFFAEMSGVDVATEVYRVADGRCIMSRRDRSQQKYVVQAEKTVRKIATSMANDIAAVMKDPAATEMDPLIDGLVTTPALSSTE
jgi:AAA ATPase containing von Willebrand factor type A (vWA) domain